MTLTPPLTGFGGLQGSEPTKDIIKHPHIEIGDYTYGEPQVLIGPYARLKIGKFCAIAPGVFIHLTTGHQPAWASTYPFALLNNWYPAAKPQREKSRQVKGDIVIGNDVWLGQNTTILPGVTIGNGAIIGACSVVTKDVPAYCIAAGNPCRMRRYRFTKKQREGLLKLRWWDWPIEKIQLNAALLASQDIDALIKLGDSQDVQSSTS